MALTVIELKDVSVLYHGTTLEAATSIIGTKLNPYHTDKLLDFGEGFYTTPIKDQVMDFVSYRTRKKTTVVPAILEFALPKGSGDKLDGYVFSMEGTAQWKNFVSGHRSEKAPRWIWIAFLGLLQTTGIGIWRPVTLLFRLMW